MNYRTGKIDPFWPIEDVETLDYFYEPFNDPDTLDSWARLYNQKFSTGLQADFRCRQPEWTQKITQELFQQGIDLINVGTSYYKMLPGDLLPEHRDTYLAYCRYHSVDASDVFRVIVFLQDWNPGFLFEIDGNPMVQYSAGTWVGWKYQTLHMAGNIGRIPRYTLQITGTLR